MKFPNRKPTRLKDYDYSQNGYYFITICTHNKEKLFSNIVGQGLAPAEIRLSEFGEIANRELCDLQNRYNNIKIDKYVIMPNHIHAIIIIRNDAAGASPCPTLSDVIGITLTQTRKNGKRIAFTLSNGKVPIKKRKGSFRDVYLHIHCID